MNYANTAKEILANIGGSQNIISAAHCATRLRLVIGDNQKCNKEVIENIDGVKGVFEASGQLQIILGTGVVNKVYDEFISMTGITESSKEEVKQAAASKQNIFHRMIKTLGDIFVPIIPAIVASGLLMGLLEGLCNVFPSLASSGTYTIFHLFSNAAFTFLPVLIAISAAKAFGGNQFLGAVIGMIMIHPDLLNAWSVSGMDAASIPTAEAWFGLYHINLVGYQGHVIPVVIAVWFMSFLEKKLHKIVPEMIDLFVTPLVTVLVTGYLTLTIIGPIFSTVENWVLGAAQTIVTLPFGIGGFIIGGLYALTVVAGVHHMYNAIEAGMLSSIGVNIWMPIATAANVGQGAAALGVAVKTKNKKTKAMAFPASLSAFLGITEPAIFGVNIRYTTALIAGCIGGACGGWVASITGIGASAYGITGVFGFLITTHYLWQYALVMLVSASVAFLVSFILYKDPKKAETEPTAESSEPSESNDTAPSISTTAFTVAEHTVHAPLNGTAIPLSNVHDATFAEEILGKGMAILPSNDQVVAPFDGTVETLFDTKHAIGLKRVDGLELLIHIGINTVELNGDGYTAHVAAGDTITAGQPLITFDRAAIKEKGYDVTTPVIITNSDDYETITLLHTGEVTTGDAVLTYA